MRAAGIVLLAFAGLSVFWIVTGWQYAGNNPLPDPGGPGTPNTPVNTGPSGVGPGGAPSTLNGPAPGSQLAGELFPSQLKP